MDFSNLTDDPIKAIAAIIIFTLVGVLGEIARRRGINSGNAPTMEIAGALVDASSVKALTEAITELAKHVAQSLENAPRNSDIGHKLVDAVDDLSKEVRELRSEIRHLDRER